ncbi:Noc1p protein [Reticulomyxa filosa]|uniref:Noc1p protein n=1 Tax=Reticulomyxa filosa TaxID=46433 RepID=X6NKS5_RETFI|nr:Noc1p protein [Reticulomyxa filosa]|eukprot:ETO26513.1 Noc1p protein [Reticulomyxa filosa]
MAAQSRSSIHNNVDIRVGDVVIITGHRLGIVRYVGTVHFGEKNEQYLGVELKGHRDEQYGCDGTVDGKEYFKSKHEKSGVFVKSVSRVVPPEEILKKLAELNEQLLLCTCGSGYNQITANVAKSEPSNNKNGDNDDSKQQDVPFDPYYGGQLNPDSSSEESAEI